jgi:hypothetical protein
VSTYVYLQCLSHDPPLRADGESGQHLSDLPRIRHDIARRVEIVAEWVSADFTFPGHNAESMWRRNTASFLHDHQKCDIGIVDEYDRPHRVDGAKP